MNRSVEDTRITVLMTCHNREWLTRRCLQSLANQRLPHLKVILNDDASTDGTAGLHAEFPFVRVIAGSGRDYWAGGMRRAWAQIDWANTDVVALLNDDVELDAGSLELMLGLLGQDRRMLLGGAVRAPDGASITYGGYAAKNPLRRMKVTLVQPSSAAVACDTLNGNVLLMSKAAAEELGGLDEAFTHGMADFDLAWRAGRAGYDVLLAPGSVGTCSPNSTQGRWSDRSLPRRERWRKLMRPTGLPPREYLTVCRRHGGVLWPVDFISPYARVLVGR